MDRVWMKACLSFLVAVTAAGCGKGNDEEMSKRLSEASDKVVACKRELNDAKNEVNGLKRQLAQAMSNPNRIVITDPEVINLIADLRGGQNTGPTLDPKAASRVILQGAKAMQACYERALKRNAALQYQAGLGLTVDVTVQAAGNVGDVDVTPSVDKDMTVCIKAAAMRWRFPSFNGDSVVVSQKISLTPKT